MSRLTVVALLFCVLGAAPGCDLLLRDSVLGDAYACICPWDRGPYYGGPPGAPHPGAYDGATNGGAANSAATNNGATIGAATNTADTAGQSTNPPR
jgi:hypothetical protein